MSIIADAIRPFWAPNIHDVGGRLTKDLRGWICDERYAIYRPLTQSGFHLFVDTGATEVALIRALAFDAGRLASAAFESVSDVKKRGEAPKSTAWSFIKLYYAAFFSAHSILRILGSSCTQFTDAQARSVNRIASVYSVQAVSATTGFYLCRYLQPSAELEGTRLASARGVHETFWQVFNSEIGSLCQRLLLSGGSTTRSQQVVAKLSDLQGILCLERQSGTWLSQIRNEVNYRHGLGAWHPYRGFTNSNRRLYEAANRWKDDPMGMSLRSGDRVAQYHAACSFLVALCRVFIEDLSNRCHGRSCHEYGALAFLNHAGLRTLA